MTRERTEVERCEEGFPVRGVITGLQLLITDNHLTLPSWQQSGLIITRPSPESGDCTHLSTPVQHFTPVTGSEENDDPAVLSSCRQQNRQNIALSTLLVSPDLGYRDKQNTASMSRVSHLILCSGKMRNERNRESSLLNLGWLCRERE